MNRSFQGTATAAVGVVLGFVAIFMDFFSGFGHSSKYSDDGSILAFLLVTLILTAILLAAYVGGNESLGIAAAVTGSIAFGFYLFIPGAYGFNHFDVVATGAWLGVCTGLIPLGLLYARASTPRAVTSPPLEAALPAIVGRLCCLIALWWVADSGTSYWNLADKGRALPALMLLLVIGGGALGVMTALQPRTHLTADGTLVLGAMTFGLYEALLIGDAFDEFGSMGWCAWLGSAGALVLLVGVVKVWKAATGRGVRPVTTAAVAPPAV